jgi:antitoxin component YwqK of YwqJK toxin-antitoxin module
MYAQKVSVTFYNSSWILTTKENAVYYRVGIIDTSNYHFFGEVKDYYINGTLQMKGKYLDNKKQDTFYFYFPDGKLKTQGYYLNNRRYGIWTNYYENNNLREKIAFDDYFIAALDSYNEQGDTILKNGNGPWNTEYYDETRNQIRYVEGFYKDTLRHNTWKYFVKDSVCFSNYEKNLFYTEEYKKGTFILGKRYWIPGQVDTFNYPISDIYPESLKFERIENWKYMPDIKIQDYPHLKFLAEIDSSKYPVDKIAEFPGDVFSLNVYFRTELKLPKSYVKSHNTVFYVVEVMVDENGKLTITEDLSLKLLNWDLPNQIFYKQVLKAIKRMPYWIPAERNGKKVKSYYILAVTMINDFIEAHLESRNGLTKKN